MTRKIKTKNEINKRIYEIFHKSDGKSVALTPAESVRVQELLWMLGVKG